MNEEAALNVRGARVNAKSCVACERRRGRCSGERHVPSNDRRSSKLGEISTRLTTNIRLYPQSH